MFLFFTSGYFNLWKFLQKARWTKDCCRGPKNLTSIMNLLKVCCFIQFIFFLCGFDYQVKVTSNIGRFPMFHQQTLYFMHTNLCTKSLCWTSHFYKAILNFPKRHGVTLSHVNVHAGIALYSQQRRNFLIVFQWTFYCKKFIWLE